VGQGAWLPLGTCAQAALRGDMETLSFQTIPPSFTKTEAASCLILPEPPGLPVRGHGMRPLAAPGRSAAVRAHLLQEGERGVG